MSANIKLHENPSSGSRHDSSAQKDGHEKAKRRFPKLLGLKREVREEDAHCRQNVMPWVRGVFALLLCPTF
jgi:hypothetical protein